MCNYVSRAELDEIGEGLIKVYINNKRQEIQSVDIEEFIESFLKLNIEYAQFAEEDESKIGFYADGTTPLVIESEGDIIPYVFPKDTIIIDKSLLAEKENGRRRFTLAHEASHHILAKIYVSTFKARFHKETIKSIEGYSKEEIAEFFANAEWQADTLAATLLMPRDVIHNAMLKFANGEILKIYGNRTFGGNEKIILGNMTKELGVSFTALVKRLKYLGMIEYHDISEYILDELHIGGIDDAIGE